MTEIRTHTYQPDQSMAPDWRDRRPCVCGFPKQWRGHDVPEQPPEVAQINARILGESEDD